MEGFSEEMMTPVFVKDFSTLPGSLRVLAVPGFLYGSTVSPNPAGNCASDGTLWLIHAAATRDRQRCHPQLRQVGEAPRWCGRPRPGESRGGVCRGP